MRWAVRLALVASLLPVASVAAPGFRITPEPAWVSPVPLPPLGPVPHDSARGGLETVLVDDQVNATVQPFERYAHRAVRVLNEQGVGDASQFQFVFDPSFQELLLHRVRVGRGGRAHDRLAPSRVRILQREQRLEYRIYDGSLTALVILEDVRPGDVIEFSYTIRGRNPALAGHYGDVIGLDGNWLPGGFRQRLLWPRGRALTLAHHSTDLRPRIVEGPTAVEYVWSLERPAAVEPEPDLPFWYVPGPYVLISSFQSWGEVARWGTQLFRPPGRPSAVLRERLDELRARHPLAEDRALAAIRLVQDDIRYLAIQFGERSLRPSDPERVLQCRFGDCKDKVLLLVTLLRELGIRADPALVSTDLGRKLVEWIPTVWAFDHAIVRIQLDGRTHWIDPTRQGQRGGALSRLHIPEYGYALVLDSTVTALTRVRCPADAESRTNIRRLFVGSDPDSATTLTVETTYRGGAAEDFRVLFAALGQEELQKRYLRYYAEVYPEVVAAGPLEIADTELLNLVRVRERYAIPRFWETPGTVGGVEAGGARQADLTAVEFREFIPSPAKGRRTMPLGVTHPRRVACETTLLTPESWDFRPESLQVDNEAIRFRYRARARAGALTLLHEYESRTDSVSVAASEAYVRDLSRIRETVYFTAQSGGNEGTDGPAWQGIGLMLALAGGATMWALRLYRPRPGRRGRFEAWLEAVPVARAEAAAEPREADGSPSTVPPPGESTAAGVDPAGGADPAAMPLRIGGWLHVLAVGLVVAPFVLSYHTITSLDLLGPHVWATLARPMEAPIHPMAAVLAVLTSGAATVLLVGSVLLVALFFRRRRSFPRTWIAYGSLATSLSVVMLVVAVPIPAIPSELKFEQAGEALRSALSLLVWGIYLSRSERVRRTFVR